VGVGAISIFESISAMKMATQWVAEGERGQNLEGVGEEVEAAVSQRVEVELVGQLQQLDAVLVANLITTQMINIHMMAVSQSVSQSEARSQKPEARVSSTECEDDDDVVVTDDSESGVPAC
jgi:hypothetical protein